MRRESTTSRRSAYPQGVAAADPDDLLAAGSAALAAGQWAGARAAFEDALAREPTAEAHAGLADVLWWVGETQASVQHHERAYAAFRHRDDLPNAAMGAVGLYLTYRASLGRTAVARGWLARAARMVEEAGLAPLAGWVALLLRHADRVLKGPDPSHARRSGETTRGEQLAHDRHDVTLLVDRLEQREAAQVHNVAGPLAVAGETSPGTGLTTQRRSRGEFAAGA